jgi:hypothetical protein
MDLDNQLEKLIKTELDTRASHKIQINFGPGRSGIKDFKALITLWESGRFFHGGGDGHLYSCMDHRLFEKDNTTPPSALPVFRRMQKEGRTEWGCGHPIGSADIRGPAALCPGCKNLINVSQMTGQLPFYGSVQDLSELVTILFHKLKDNADIYCKYDRTDIRYKMQETKNGVEEAHKLRGLLIYPLYRILADTASGSSIEGRFKALFLA